jgi:hypothetical protein
MSPTPVSGTISDDALAALSESSRACIERLCKHEPERFELTNEYVLDAFFGPMRRWRLILLHNHRHVLAAVLVLLYERAGTPSHRGSGGLRVLLTTRSKELRSHPGETALPGGKVDQSDAGVVETAVRLQVFCRRSGRLTAMIYMCIYIPMMCATYSSGKRTRKWDCRCALRTSIRSARSSRSSRSIGYW